MFGQSPKNIEDNDTSDLESILFSQESEQSEIDMAINDTESTLSNSHNQPEIVNVVEKISGILSPYFIVLVGLFLYENNFFIGTLLIFVGIFSLLKLSWKDIKVLLDQIQKFFKSDTNIS
ncbi:MAG: hypothetical protein ACKO2V_24530 [Snowella sp.]